MCTSVANDPKRNVFKARKMFYKVVQYTYIKDVPFTLHHLTKTKAKELLLLRLHTGLQESDLRKKMLIRNSIYKAIDGRPST